jgi:hypothetical protein
MAYFTNESLKSAAQKILTDFETGGASWEGVALTIAALELRMEAAREGLGIDYKIDLGSWDGSFCANEKDVTIYDPKCCDHDFESGCACCMAECENCQEDEQNIQ